jgi:hypothetical protein
MRHYDRKEGVDSSLLFFFLILVLLFCNPSIFGIDDQLAYCNRD